MHAEADHVAGLNAGRINLDEGLIHDCRVSITFGGCSGQNVQPTRGDDGRAERHITGVYEVNIHAGMTCFP